MLTIYLPPVLDSIKPNIVLYNDLWFDVEGSKIKFEDAVVQNTLRFVENADYKGDYKVTSKFHGGLINVTDISTGCKIALNVLSFNNKIFSADECGNNAISAIIKNNVGNIYLSVYKSVPTFKNKTIKVKRDNMSKTVTNSSELQYILGECL